MSRRPRDICAEVNPDKTEACTKHRHHRSPHSWQMDRAAALAEAQRRWGRGGEAGPRTSATRPENTCHVGRYVNVPNYADRAYDSRRYEQMGEGPTYEAAFADADRRAQR